MKLLTCLAVCSTIIANNAAPSTTKIESHDYSQRVQIGGVYSYAWISPKGNNTTKGSLGGVRAIYEYRPEDYVYAAAAFTWRGGKTKHDGTERRIWDSNGQERLGYTFGKKRIGDNRLTLFTGFGVRYLDEHVHVGSASLTLNYTEFYVPVGFLYEHKVNSWFSFGCDFQWMPQVFPTVRLKPLSGTHWSLKEKYNNFFAEFPLTFKAYKDRLSVIISPFVETWNDGRSTAVTSNGLALNLPQNSYLFTGLNASLGVAF